MNHTNLGKADSNSQKAFAMLAEITKKHLSEPTHKKIFFILKEETAIGKEQRYQAISRITDILRTTHQETEIMEKLTEAFPKYK